MPFFEEIAQLLTDAFNKLREFPDSISAITAGWDSFVALLKAWWESFSGFFTGLFIK